MSVARPFFALALVSLVVSSVLVLKPGAADHRMERVDTAIRNELERGGRAPEVAVNDPGPKSKFTVRPQKVSEEPPPLDVRSELDRISSDIEILRIQLVDIRRWMEEMNTTMSSAVVNAQNRYAEHIDDELEVVDDPDDFNDSAERAREQAEFVLETLDESFYAETQDQQWALDTVNFINEVVTADGLAELVDSYDVQCRSSLCRLVVDSGGTSEQREFLGEFNVRVGETLPAATMVRENLPQGQSRLTVYLATEGDSLPTLEPEEEF